MADVYEILAERLLEAAAKTEPPQKFFVALAGPPGSGKSTLSSEVITRVNAKWRQQQRPGQEDVIAVADVESSDVDSATASEVAAVAPMDGFHLYRHELDAMEDPQEAHARRGAPWTFDPKGFHTALVDIRDKGFGYLPSFDHAVGDPVPDDIFIPLSARVVIVEGNYLLMEDGHWADIASLLDETWFIDVDVDEAMRRVESRHVGTGLSVDKAKEKVDYNDRPNALLIMSTKHRADIVVTSISECHE